MLALGGDCLADVAALRAEPELFGPVLTRIAHVEFAEYDALPQVPSLDAPPLCRLESQSADELTLNSRRLWRAGTTGHRLTKSSPGILSGMTVTTIKVPKTTRDRLHRLAQAEGITLAQAIEKLMDQSAPRPRPSVGGFRSEAPLDAGEIDAELARGFGA